MNHALSKTQAEQFQAAMQALSSHQPEAALQIARNLVREAPGTADAQQLLGMCLGENGLRREAQSAFERALELAPGSMVVKKNFGLFLIKQGKFLREQSDFENAVKSLRRAVRINPQHAAAWAELGLALRFSGNIEAALQAFQQAQALGINSPGLRNLDQYIVGKRQKAGFRRRPIGSISFGGTGPTGPPGFTTKVRADPVVCQTC